ncbi:MAG TPA: tripartite tricarboxylate transporter substrate binding protein [Burkholderiales bacterium]|nr:tripartite tricarboxylate transporter substrate binding protein [Burkholderiales bacterium]
MRSTHRCTGNWLLVGVLAVCGSYAHAQAYPSKPIEFVAHTSAGSGTDLFGRNVSNLIEKEKIFAQPITHSNRVGGLGTVAFNYIKGKRGDPHVILTVATGSMLNAASRPELELPLSTYTPLAFFAQDPQAIAVRSESKITTIPDLLEAAKREPTGLTVGLTSAVGTGRFITYSFERDTGAKFRIVSFKGGGDAVLATLGGHVEMTAENLSEMLSLYETKKMRVLAVTGERRFARAPEVPTLKELGFNIVAATGRGFAMPAGVPKEAAATMEGALKRVHDSPAYKEYAERNIFEDKYLGSAEFAQYLVAKRLESEEFLRTIGMLKP